MSVVGLERVLVNYCKQGGDRPFDLKSVPLDMGSARESTSIVIG